MLLTSSSWPCQNPQRLRHPQTRKVVTVNYGDRREEVIPLKVILIGLDHRTQWEDRTGDLRALLARIVGECGVELIAEEAYKLPTTIGFRLACRTNIPWIDIDMTDAETQEAGIREELTGRPHGPLLKGDGKMVDTVGYLPHADALREEHWTKKVIQYRVSSSLSLCGLLHLGPFAAKLRSRGCTVNELNVCDQDWYKQAFGSCQVVEENGRRWCEFPVK